LTSCLQDRHKKPSLSQLMDGDLEKLLPVLANMAIYDFFYFDLA